MWEDELLKRNIAVTTGKTKTVDLPIVEDEEEDCIELWHNIFSTTRVTPMSKSSYSPFPEGPPTYAEMATLGNEYWCNIRDGNFLFEVEDSGNHLELFLTMASNSDLQDFTIMISLYNPGGDVMSFITYDRTQRPVHRTIQHSILNDFYNVNNVDDGSDLVSLCLSFIKMFRRGSRTGMINLVNLTSKLIYISEWFNKNRDKEVMKRQITTTTGKTKTVDTPLVEDDEQDCIEEWLNFFKTLPINVDITRSQMETYGEEYWCELMTKTLTYQAFNQTSMEYAAFSFRLDNNILSEEAFIYFDDSPLELKWSFGFENISLYIREFGFQQKIRGIYSSGPKEIEIIQPIAVNTLVSDRIAVEEIYETYKKFRDFILKNGGSVKPWNESSWQEFEESIFDEYINEGTFSKSLVSRTKGKTKTVNLPIVEDDEEDCVQQWVDFLNDLLDWDKPVDREFLLKHGDNDFWCKMKTLEAVTFDAGWGDRGAGIVGVKYRLNYSSYLFIGVKLDTWQSKDPTFSQFIQLSVGGDGRPSYQVLSDKRPFELRFPNLNQYTEEGREWYTSRLYKDGWLYEGWWKERTGIRKHPSNDFLEYINETMDFLHNKAKSFLTTQDNALEAELLFIIHWDEWIYETNYEFNDKKFIKSLITERKQ